MGVRKNPVSLDLLLFLSLPSEIISKESECIRAGVIQVCSGSVAVS